jgi:hypothetical protein
MAGAVEDAAAAMPDKPKKRSSPEGPDVPVAAGKQAKPAVDERAFVVQEDVKALGHKIVRQQAGAVSRISVVPGAASKLLCVITNDAVAAKRRMEENGNKELFIVSATVLQVCTVDSHLVGLCFLFVISSLNSFCGANPNRSPRWSNS